MNALCFSGFVREEQLVVLHGDFPFEVVANVECVRVTQCHASMVYDSKYWPKLVLVK
jgi:hypothetical protein